MSVSVRKFKDGRRWTVDVRALTPGGERVRDRRVIGGTKPQARAWGVEREHELIEGRGKPVIKDVSPTFDTYAEAWLKSYGVGLRPSTIRYVRKTVRVHLGPFFGRLRLDKIDHDSLVEFLAVMAKKPSGKKDSDGNPLTLSMTTLQHAKAVLALILKAAVKSKKMDSLPEFPTLKKEEALKLDFYNVSECELLLNSAATQEERLTILFALHTGARAGEQIGLEWDDVQTAGGGRVDLRRSRVEGHTSQTTKNRKARSVPLSPQLLAGLKAHKHLRGKYVFCHADGSPLNLINLHRILKRAAHKAGLRKLRWHDLRHSFASNLTIGGTPIRQVQEWMGHSSITMTMRYAHLAPGGGREHLGALTMPLGSPGMAASV